MAERTSVSETGSYFTPDPAMDAALDAKLEAAAVRGVDLSAFASLSGEDGESFDRAKAEIGFTDDELHYMAGQSLYGMAQQVVGQKIVETLNANGCRVGRDDLIPSVAAYFRAVDEGQMPTPSSADQIVQPDPQASDITPSHEVRVLVSLMQSFGVQVHIAEETQEPFFIFDQQTSEMGAGVVAQKISERFRAEPQFKAAFSRQIAVQSGLIPVGGTLVETEAEKLISELDELGFLTSVLHNGGQPTRLDVAFERYGPLVAEVETLQLMDRIHERFRNDSQFANDLVDYCVSVGSYYDERR